MVESQTEKEATQVITRVGKQLSASKSCPNKDTIIKLLKQATSAFLELKQSESLKLAVRPLSDSLIRHGLLHYEDKDVRLLVGICLCEIIRVLAPNPDFSETVIRDIFGLLLRMFAELDDMHSPYFSRRTKSLEIVAKLKFCLLMLDTGCEDLVIKMFKSFFSVVRNDHPQSLITSISSIITCILEEKAKEADSDALYLKRNTSQPLLDVLLQNLIKDRKGESSASFQLAVTVIQDCGEKLEYSISQFLTSCIFNRDAVGSVVKEHYHEIIFEIFQIAPQMLLSVAPNLTHELLIDQVDVRIKALKLIRELLSLPHRNFVQDYPHVFIELLNRFSDKSAEVRIVALSCAKAFCTRNQSGRESLECLSAIQGRLLDHDDRVRTEAVNVVCELAKTNPNFASPDLISLAADRLRDKKVIVRSKALKKLVELYQKYCMWCEEGFALNEHIEEIPCKLLLLCYEKDCQEFRPQSMELVLADLFPKHLSVEERTRHWIYMFSLFKPPHLKALRIILSQKRRLQDGLRDYLDLWNRTEEIGSGEREKKFEAVVVKMSSCFPDPIEAKGCFQKLNELKDVGIIYVLQKLINNEDTLGSGTTKDEYLRRLGEQRVLSEFFRLLSTKCSFNIFSSKHVHCVLVYLSGDGDEDKHLKNYSVQLLLTIVGAFPLLLTGLEKQFQLLLLENEIPFDNQLLETLAREGSHMSIKLSDIYSSLEKICFGGTRAQSKLAVSAIAALAETSEHYIFSELCKKLVDSLCNRQSAPTVLQSLGCLAQYSISAFEAQEKVITHYILKEVFQQENALIPKNLASLDGTSKCCNSCKLKVFGLKALVRSFLPHKCTSVTRPVSFLLDIIQQMLQNAGCPGGKLRCECDEAYIRLAAANSVLRLTRKWDLHISPQIFHLTVLMAKDPSPWVRRSFVSKIHKFLKNRTLPCSYACTFSFVALDPLTDLREDALKYLKEFIGKFGEGTKVNETMAVQGAPNHPAYLVVFLIHVLAHDTMFPSPDCEDEKVYAKFLSPLFITLELLVSENFVVRKISSTSYLRSILNAIKKAHDAVDDQMTMKLHLLAEVGISILNSLNTNNKPVPHTPGLILLPSSLYKSGPDAMGEPNVCPLIGYKADASFRKLLVYSLKSEVSGIGSTRTNCSRQFFENSLRPSDSRHRGSDSKSSSADNLLMNKTKDPVNGLHTGQREQCRTSHQEDDTRGGLDHIVSCHGSFVLHDECSAEYEHKTDAPRILEAKLPFPCESATTNSMLFQKNVLSSLREEDTTSRGSSANNEQSKSSRACEHVNRTSPKNIKINGEALVGKHIKLWSRLEKCYFSGIVDTFDSSKSTHKITYDSGEVEILSLDSEKWEIDLDDLPSSSCVHGSDSSAKGQREILDASGCDSERENIPNNRESYVRNVPQAVKRNKRRRDAISTSTSEVIDVKANTIARRTRSQKV